MHKILSRWGRRIAPGPQRFNSSSRPGSVMRTKPKWIQARSDPLQLTGRAKTDPIIANKIICLRAGLQTYFPYRAILAIQLQTDRTECRLKDKENLNRLTPSKYHFLILLNYCFSKKKGGHIPCWAQQYIHITNDRSKTSMKIQKASSYIHTRIICHVS